MLRPFLAFVTLCVAAFVLAPTVASVHSSVEGLQIHRPLPWQLWKWDQTPEPPKIVPPDCNRKEFHLISAVTAWPARIDKNTTFEVTGTVITQELNQGVPGIDVEVFLNATKEKPGEFLGRTQTNSGGGFSITAKVPHELSANRYHIVAHALEHNESCKHYLEHFSDPEMDVTSQTRVIFDAPPRAVIGHDVNVTGKLVDAVAAPVRNATLAIKIDNQTSRLTTDATGQFVVHWKATRAGNVTVSATFSGTKFYAASDGSVIVPILPEDIEIIGYDIGHPLQVERSTATVFNGIVYLAPGVARTPLTLSFDGLAVAPCATCPPRSTLTVAQDAQGAFNFTVLAPAPQVAPTFILTVTGGGLKDPHTFHGALSIPVHVSLNATGTGLFSRGYRGNVSATDENGAALPGPIALYAPSGWVTLTSDANGTAVFDGKGSCGKHTVQAYYNGTSPYRSGLQEHDVAVCGILAFIPPWLLAMPWWGWGLIAITALLAWLIARKLYEKHAPTLTRGPPMRVALARTADDGPPDITGLGEEVLLVARLDAPLPAGHRLRMGHHRKLEWRDMQDALEATFAVTPEQRGDLPLRAEIIDEKGRVVTRRSITLHVVRYAEEIEQRYRDLKRDTLEDASDIVSPREFEAWLRSNAPTDLDPLVAKRLVAVFEEADYGPREATRNEFLAFLAAANGFAPAARAPRAKGVRSRA